MILSFIRIWKVRYCFSVPLAILLWFPIKIKGQELQGIRPTSPSKITLQVEANNFVPLSGGVIVPNLAWFSGVNGAVPIGFSFSIGCNEFTSFHPSSAGTISFNNSTYVGTQPILAGNTAMLAPLWSDLVGNSRQFSYKTIGTAPNRVLIAEWKDWQWYGESNSNLVSFQVKLYEGTNIVEYIYNTDRVSKWKGTIGLYDNLSTYTSQLWLSDTGINPATSTTIPNLTVTKPATGQLYRFTLINDSCQYYGQTVINPSGGAKAVDGLKINLSGTGNMQISRNGMNQLYKDEILYGTTDPFGTPGGGVNGLGLSVGTSFFYGGSLLPSSGWTSSNKLTMMSSTKQSLIESRPNHFENVIKMSATKGTLVYLLEVKYTYDFPASSFLIDYKVTIPVGNTEKVKFAHGWDTFLAGGDRGPGFVAGTAPNYIMGVKKTPSYEAFQYKGGVPWSGFYSAHYNQLNNDLGSSFSEFMVFDNKIDHDDRTDNSIGISIDFGSAPGTFTSNNMIVFSCEAGDIAPTLKTFAAKPCTGTSFDLNSYLTSTTPTGAKIVWKKGTTVVSDPTNLNVAGTYTVSYYSPLYDCNSPEATITVTYDDTCAVCYKPGVTMGTSESVKTIISILDRVSVPRNMSDHRTGSMILESKTKGFVITRMVSPETKITSPIEGMIVYDTLNNVIKLYNGTVWKTLVQSCPDY